MGRVWKNWTDEKVGAATVAPHRYLWSGAVGADGKLLGDVSSARTFEEAKACFAYNEGDVIYLESGYGAVKAKVVLRLYLTRDAYGFRAEAYRVVRETAKGLWSKQWEEVHPGFIQRGYQRAGLAPDVDKFQPLSKPPTEKAGA